MEVAPTEMSVEETVEEIRKLALKTRYSYSIVFHALIAMSGNFAKAEQYLSEGVLEWTANEDKTLLQMEDGTDAIESIQQRHGPEATVARCEWLG